MTTTFNYEKTFTKAKETGKGFFILKIGIEELNTVIRELKEYNENISYEVYKVSEYDMEYGDFGYDIVIDVLSVK